jgi:hypothetical protein
MEMYGLYTNGRTIEPQLNSIVSIEKDIEQDLLDSVPEFLTAEQRDVVVCFVS